MKTLKILYPVITAIAVLICACGGDSPLQNSGNSCETGTQVSSSLSRAYYPNIAVTGGKVHVIWHDIRNGSANSELCYDFNPTANTIGITNLGSEISNSYSLSQNYPNPFNSTTNIKFQ